VAGVTAGGVMPNNPYKGSSCGVSGWISNTFSQRVVDDVDGSEPGSERDPLARHCQPGTAV
jgi:hypothetical protein